MKPIPTEIALLEDALVALEKVLAHNGGELQGVPYLGPTSNAPLEVLQAESAAEAERMRSSAAHSALNICLSSAAALVDVSVALMNCEDDERPPQEVESDWHALITHTKIASRSAYRAALIMAAQINLLQGQGALPAANAAPSGPAASLGC